MKPSPSIPVTIDEYIAGFPRDVQAMLEQLRSAIRKAAPAATEKISYRIPTFYLNGNLVHFAAAKHHIGFYPTSSGVREFQSELSAYKTSKGAIQLPLNAPIPVALIRKIVQFRVTENLAKSAAKKQK